MDHMFARPNIVGATNKDSITITRFRALCDTINFNLGSWTIALIVALLAYLTILQEEKWDYTVIPSTNLLQHALFAGPAFFLSIMTLIVPIILNPWILGWPFLRKRKIPKQKKPTSSNNDKKSTLKPVSNHGKTLDGSPGVAKQSFGSDRKPSSGTRDISDNQKLGVKSNSTSNNNNLSVSQDTSTMTVDLGTLMKMNVVQNLSNEMQRAQNERDVEIGSVDIRTIGPASTMNQTASGGGNDTVNRITKGNGGKQIKSTSNVPSPNMNGSNINRSKSNVQRIDTKYIAEREKEYHDIEVKQGLRSNNGGQYILDLEDSTEEMPPPKDQISSGSAMHSRSLSFDESFLTRRFANLFGMGQQQQPSEPSYNQFSDTDQNDSSLPKISTHSKKTQTPVFVSAHAFSPPPVIKSGSILSPTGTVQQQQHQHQHQSLPSSAGTNGRTPTTTNGINDLTSPVERRWNRMAERSTRGNGIASVTPEKQPVTSPTTTTSTIPSPQSSTDGSGNRSSSGDDKYPMPRDKWGFPQTMDTGASV